MTNLKSFLKLNRLTIALIILLLLSIAVPITYSRFQSTGIGKSNIEAAFYVLKAGYQTTAIKIDSITPSNKNYTYTFTVSNNDGTNRCETDMDYTVKLTTTTNLPLTYNIYQNNENTNIIAKDTIDLDEDGTYFRNMETPTVRFSHTKDEINTYQIVINFPEEYTDEIYQNVVEGLLLSIDSKQVIDE